MVVLLIILLAVLGGGWWFLKSNRDRRENEAWAFANEGATHIVLQKDMRFLNFNLTQKAQMTYPPSWRMRLMDMISEAGTPNPEFHMKGTMRFVNHFFQPEGTFIAQFDCPRGPAYLELQISHPGALWVIDNLNWTWQPPPPPPPTPTPIPTATPSPSPTPTPSATAGKRRSHR